ncbi:MAG: adenylate/guanylate cyclase domain-containing protein, partial [Pseudomonadota bacterium]
GAHRRDADLELAVGAHYGPVVIGNIGSTKRLEFAVLGDTVNVASRLESATRDIGCRCLASAALVSAAQTEGQPGMADLQAQVAYHGTISLRGRQDGVEVFKM